MVYIQHLIDEPRAWQRPVSKVYDANRVSGEFYYRVIEAFIKMVLLKCLTLSAAGKTAILTPKSNDTEMKSVRK